MVLVAVVITLWQTEVVSRWVNRDAAQFIERVPTVRTQRGIEEEILEARDIPTEGATERVSEAGENPTLSAITATPVPRSETASPSPTETTSTPSPSSTSVPTPTPRPPSTCPGAPPQRVQIGDRAWVCTAHDKLIVRQQPGLVSSEIARLEPGAYVTIIAGPECADSWSWWRVRTATGVSGWIAEGGDEVDPYFLCPLE